MANAGLFSLLPSRRGLLGINGRNLEYIYPYNARRFFPNVDDKLRCKQLLSEAGIPVPKTYQVIDGPRQLKDWPRYVAQVESFVIKPNRGYGGNGIQLVRKTGAGFSSGDGLLDADDITFHIMQICSGAFSHDNFADIAFLEETIINHPDLSELVGPGVSGVVDVRLILRGEEPVMAMARVPTRASKGRANLHQGGIGIGIDLETGSTMNGCHHNGVISEHPETGRVLAGQILPGFTQLLEYGSAVCEIVKLGYIGVDFVCDERSGWQVLEVNARPGLNIQIANQMGLRKRLV
ncbi:MAG TPA: sugar-transfer associated ATP-grasp domain-containing protein [Candidatus Deferrimicrobium sp.]|nr:sugar-transfer associated ATP-grasp domain-containing protein [Candidatus Deferrimicrobium sp.]